MQTLKLTVLFGWLAIFSCAQKPAVEKEKLAWMSLDEVAASMKKEKRPILIDLYTDWCGWCKVMDKKTYSNKNVGAYLKQKFYPVKLNAEQKKDITWNGKTYTFNSNYKTHNFAVYLTNGQLSYPTTVIIPVNGDPQAIPGYLTPPELEPVVKYFGEGKYGKTGFEEHLKGFKSQW
jgi:Highly conserved protein containing a thioredoxin domain